MKFLEIFLSPSRKWWDSTSIRLQQLPSKSLPIHPIIGRNIVSKLKVTLNNSRIRETPSRLA
jgi:hypothetical protein